MPETFLTPYLEWLQETPISVFIREDAFWYPWLISLHVMGNATAVGLILALDFRLMGLGMKKTPISALFTQLRPWSIAGIVVQMITGAVLFLSEPMKCYESKWFWIKMAAIGLALANALAFDKTLYPKVKEWDTTLDLPVRVKLAGASSLIMWATAIYAGRWLAYG